jgi:hypothetical protein
MDLLHKTQATMISSFLRFLSRSVSVTFACAVIAYALLPSKTFAQSTYSCGSYGASSYSSNCAEDSGGGETANPDQGSNPEENSGGTLSDTGEQIQPYIIIGIASITGGAVLLLKSKHQKA